MADSDYHPRPRRTRQDSAKHYDATRKDLQLSEVLDVLQCYVDYGGGINCCVCGKLYKSRVCFIKHLWEHTVYWDMFAGDKNHMRVLSIQAALILYGSCQPSLTTVPVDSLLVTSPTTEHSSEASHSPTPKKAAPPKLPTTPVKQGISSSIPITPAKPKSPSATPETPPKRNSFPLKRKAPQKLDFGVDVERRPNHFLVVNAPLDPPHPVHLPDPAADNVDQSGFHTPERQGIPFVIPKAPRKKCRRRLLVDDDSVSSLGWNCTSRPRVSRFLNLSSESKLDEKCTSTKSDENNDTLKSDENCWKSSDNSCKRKRAE